MGSLKRGLRTSQSNIKPTRESKTCQKQNAALFIFIWVLKGVGRCAFVCVHQVSPWNCSTFSLWPLCRPPLGSSAEEQRGQSWMTWKTPSSCKLPATTEFNHLNNLSLVKINSSVLKPDPETSPILQMNKQGQRELNQSLRDWPLAVWLSSN